MAKNVNFFKRMEFAQFYCIEHGMSEGYDFLSDLNSFVSEGSFCRGKQAKLFLKLRKNDDAKISSLMGCSEASVRRHRMETSNKLYELFGDKFFDLFFDGKIETCKGILRIVKGELSVDDLFNTDIETVLLENPSRESIKGDTFNFEDCMRELEFLSRHSKARIESEMVKLDKNKLLFILNFLKKSNNAMKKVELVKIWKVMQNRPQDKI